MSVAHPRSRPAGPLRLPRTTAMPALVAVAATAWIVAGLVGLYVYVHHYSLYRGFAPPKAAVGVAHGSLRRVSFWSPALHQTRYADVYLPPGYRRAAARGTRFPVLYLLHGHPGRPRSLLLAGALVPTADRLIGHHRIPPMIIVMPDGEPPRSGLSDEWANGRYGRYEGFFLDTVHMTDQRFATRANRAGRVIAGLSEGGYGAANLTLRHLGMFSGFQSWSGYFLETPTGTFAGAPPSVIAANSPAYSVARRAGQIRRAGLKAFLYAGSADHGGVLRLQAFAPQLAAAGAQVQTGVYAGGHDWGLWRGQLPHMLRVAGSWLR